LLAGSSAICNELAVCWTIASLIAAICSTGCSNTLDHTGEPDSVSTSVTFIRT
jgi:hypothetical protein